MAYDFYTDVNLTSPAPSPIQVSHNSDFSDNPQDFQYYLGSLDASRKIEANSNPGVDNIIISVADTTPASGHETTEILLATTQLGLDSATPGASLTVGTSVLSGTGGKFEFWVRVVNAVTTVGISTELSFTTNTLKESAQ
jgi:hypothetical protein